VFVKVLFNNIESTGRATAHDVLEASAKAYINAVNRILNRRQREETVENKVHI
jgi:2-isopropylmalate synthase